MRLALPGGPHLTYCTNIHAGETWQDIEASLAHYLPEVKRRVSPDAPMGVGLRLSGEAAATLGDDLQLETLVRFLDAHDLYVFTINAFPYGPFHGQTVKEQVYEPDWRSPERLAFTNRCADILAVLLCVGQGGSISTVPGAFKASIEGVQDYKKIAESMIHHAAHLQGILQRTGTTIILALEPEPCCMLETTKEAIDFFETYLFGADSVALFQSLTGASAGDASDALRRHLGLCFDVCHAAVEFEDVEQSLERLAAAGVSVAKVQLSSALKVSKPGPDIGTLLAPFNDGIYLHQTVASHGHGLSRHVDIPQALSALRNGQPLGCEWRVHCHVPVFLESFGAMGSTQDVLKAVLDLCRRREVSPHLEVETYTWSVLPQALRQDDMVGDIAREVQWVRTQLRA